MNPPPCTGRKPLRCRTIVTRSIGVPTTEAEVPTYQYACTACGHQLEAVQSFADEPLTECPACEGRLRKLFSAVGIVFKGSGFYRTDSRPGEKVGAGADGSKTGASTDAAARSDGGKSDSAKDSGATSDRGRGTAGGTKKAPAGAGAPSSGSTTAPAHT